MTPFKSDLIQVNQLMFAADYRVFSSCSASVQRPLYFVLVRRGRGGLFLEFPLVALGERKQLY